MSAFTDALVRAAQGSAGISTGDPEHLHRASWAEVHAVARRAAARLRDRGLRPGAAVAVLAGAPGAVAPVAQAVWLAGGSVTMLHQPTPRTDMVRFAEETGVVLGVIRASLVVLGEPFESFLPMVRAAGADAVTVTELLAPGEQGGPGGTERDGLPVEVDESSPALLQLTSGSTATPKAVRITHGNLWANVVSMCATAGLTDADTMVSWLPLFHDMGMVGFLTLPMCRGIETVAVTPRDFLADPLSWPRLISRTRGTATAAPNFAFALTARVLARAQEEFDLSTMRFALNGAEPIDVDAVAAFAAAGARFGLPDTAVVCAYGMAEATLGVAFQPRGTPVQVDTVLARELEEDRRAVPAGPDPDAPVRRFPRLGPPLGGIELSVRAEDGTELGEREVGVLHLRGDSITERYLTVDGPRPTRGADNWLDTGDLGYLVDGEVVVCGRVKDVIIMGGRNLYPTDIEKVAGSVDGVRAGNAVAVRWTAPGGRESFAVAVESRAAADVGEADRIAAEVRSAVTAAMGVRPAVVRVLPPGSLPKTPSGKLRRTAAAGLIAGAS